MNHTDDQMFYKSGPYVVQVRKRSSSLLINTAVITDTRKLLGFIKKKIMFHDLFFKPLLNMQKGVFI